MKNRSKIFVVLPAYNEDDVIESHLVHIKEAFDEASLPLEMVVVDDGSSDSTADKVQKLQENLPIVLIKHGKNQGLGAALKTGFMALIERSQDNDFILTTESDGTQNPKKLVDIALALNDGTDLVIANPLGKDGFKNVPFYRQFFSQGGNLLYRLLFPIPGLTDYTNLSRGFRASLLKKALSFYGENNLFDRTGFESVPDLILKLRRFQPRAAEIPIQINYSAKKRSSTMNVPKTILKSLGLCWKHLTG